MVQCKKCKLFLSVNKDDVIRCKGGCDAVFHKKCVVNNKQFLRDELCEGCAKKEGSPKPSTPKLNIDLSKDSAEKVLSEVNTKLEVIYNLQKQISDMKDVVDFYSEKYQEMVAYKDISEKKIKALENKNIHLQTCNDALEERILYLESKETEKNIEVVGMEEHKNENTRELVVQLAEQLKINPSTVETVKRVGREKPDLRPRTIVLTLCTKNARDDWITKRKNVITNSAVFKNKNEQRIYINESLPRALRELFWNAKAALKNKYKFIWVQTGRILVKKSEKEKTINIKNEGDIERLSKVSE